MSQARVRQLAGGPGITVVCGRFEGIDERVIAGRSLEEVSIGDYVLAGGEIAAMAVIDACVRLIPGVMGNAASATDVQAARKSVRDHRPDLLLLDVMLPDGDGFTFFEELKAERASSPLRP